MDDDNKNTFHPSVTYFSIALSLTSSVKDKIYS